MKLGMYSLEVQRPSSGELFNAIREYGFSQVQFDFASVCSEEMPESLEPGFVNNIYEQAKAKDVEIIAVNGTFNMIHPDARVRLDGLKRLEVIAGACKALHCNLITLCTGTRNPGHMWSWHEDNLSPKAWEDLLVVMEKALDIAERYNVLLGIECEASNCINTPERARLLLDRFNSPRLGIIMDAANLFRPGAARKENFKGILDNAFELLGKNVCLAHGKDVKEGEGLDFTYAGNGIVNFDYFVQKLGEYGYSGGMLLHGIKDESLFPWSVSFIRDVLGRV